MGQSAVAFKSVTRQIIKYNPAPVFHDCNIAFILIFAILELWLRHLYNSGPRNSLYCLGHFKNVYDNDDDDDEQTMNCEQICLFNYR